MEHIIDSITGQEPWIEEILCRLEGGNDVYEVASIRVAILEALGFIERTDNFGLGYALTNEGRFYLAERRYHTTYTTI